MATVTLRSKFDNNIFFLLKHVQTVQGEIHTARPHMITA